MKNVLAIASLALTFAAQPVFSAAQVAFDNDATVEHSGGCRKDSPAGQCCHAGSKPYHCH